VERSLADSDGNARGGHPTFRFGSTFRHACGAESAPRSRLLTGAAYAGAAYVPFAPTNEERESNGDPRPSIRERDRDLVDYKGRIEATAQALTASGFLLPRMPRKSLPPPPPWCCRNDAWIKLDHVFRQCLNGTLPPCGSGASLVCLSGHFGLRRSRRWTRSMALNLSTWPSRTWPSPYRASRRPGKNAVNTCAPARSRRTPCNATAQPDARL